MKKVLFSIFMTVVMTLSSMADETTPSAIVATFFRTLQSGDVSKIEILFRCTNDTQRSYVNAFVNKGAEFFSSGKVKSVPIAEFVSTNAAIVAIEQTHVDFPEKREVERGCLVRTPNGWRLLPNPEGFNEQINGLSEDISIEFDRLNKDYESFNDAEKKKVTKKKSEPPPARDGVPAAHEE